MDRQQVAAHLADVLLTSFQMQTAFKLKTQRGTGTCFLYGNENGVFHVTARHLIDQTHVGEFVYFAQGDTWIPTEVSAIFMPNNGHDIAAFVTTSRWNVGSKFDTKCSLYPGQPVKFLGFPHGLNSNYPSQNGFSTPLVRSAHFSGIIQHGGLTLTVLDGFNNPGYSGGPVYSCGDDGRPAFFGIISSYRYETESHSLVYKKNEQGEYEPLQDYIVRPNSGMIYMTGRKECDDLFMQVDQFQPT
ncbi:serine protease [Erythrobacter sp. CCH5-A1]|jgi:hypothetical protein|uniref:S1 family peptidase n=1 Tax=Erythrobacter sp. CCH5-A1 TaxID=1768792 RepID=UPI000B3377A4|nr:serine protease [Erythrobacter sp. CCH5-A1]